ncbi:MAG: proline dehydrogenase family protein [Planctomycetes bacterium]|nr:proline dehydrogenase family protein [Planctomycetota bacterium]
MNPMKDCFLFLSKRTLLQKLLSTSGPCKIISRRFVSGETLDESIHAAKDLNKHGILVTMDHLGESVCDESSALEAADEYLNILEKIKPESGNNITVSLKLTQMGLDIGDNFCLDNMRRIMNKVRDYRKLLTIDMEDTPYTDRTLNIYTTLLKEGFAGTGIVIQAYLRRSEADIRNLLALGPRIRLCKGAYKEPAKVAFPDKKDVDSNYTNLLAIMFSKDALAKGTYPEVASHDENIINWTINHVRQNHIPADKFEFQMLYGIRRDLQEKLVSQGYRMRVYLPYGTHWYPYFMRRLAERPANVWFMVKNMCYR